MEVTNRNSAARPRCKYLSRCEQCRELQWEPRMAGLCPVGIGVADIRATSHLLARRARLNFAFSARQRGTLYTMRISRDQHKLIPQTNFWRHNAPTQVAQ